MCAKFQTSAALGVAQFFDDLSKKDMVQEDVWKEYSRNYEILAFDEISYIESGMICIFSIIIISFTVLMLFETCRSFIICHPEYPINPARR